MCHVLIIEDEWLIAEQLSHLVREAGATSTETADSQEEALQVARARIPDVILSDVKLLVGTGPRAVQIIRSEMGSIPVIFITATPEACRPCDPPSVILVKPINSAKVIDTFKRFAPTDAVAPCPHTP